MKRSEHSEATVGAIDISLSVCPKIRRYGRYRSPQCRCEKCAVCGFYKHTGVHGPVYGHPVGSKPWGHEFVPELMKR